MTHRLRLPMSDAVLLRLLLALHLLLLTACTKAGAQERMVSPGERIKGELGSNPFPVFQPCGGRAHCFCLTRTPMGYLPQRGTAILPLLMLPLLMLPLLMLLLLMLPLPLALALALALLQRQPAH